LIDIRLGDCVERTREIADASIDLILTSPPYDKLRKYASGSEFDFEGLADQCKRVLKPGGVLVWVVGDETKNGNESGSSFRQALHFQSIGLNRRDTMIWLKANPMHCGDPSHYVGAFEFMFVFTEGTPQGCEYPSRTMQAGPAKRRHSPSSCMAGVSPNPGDAW
jgi:DNA modification methylase